MRSDLDRSLLTDSEATEPGTVSLLLAPTGHEQEQDLCLELSTIGFPAGRALIWVTFVHDADHRVGGYLDELGLLPESSSVVAVGSAGDEITVTDPADVRVERVRRGEDLPRIGITISTILEEIDDGLTPILCLHSVTSLLSYADDDRVYRFLTLLKNRLQSAGGAGHYHLDPEAIDEQTLITIRQLADAVVEAPVSVPSPAEDDDPSAEGGR